jgi:hypothetical protein
VSVLLSFARQKGDGVGLKGGKGGAPLRRVAKVDGDLDPLGRRLDVVPAREFRGRVDGVQRGEDVAGAAQRGFPLLA